MPASDDRSYGVHMNLRIRHGLQPCAACRRPSAGHVRLSPSAADGEAMLFSDQWVIR